MAPIHFMSAPKPVARRVAAKLIDRHGQTDLGSASYVVAIGGDGTTLNALRSVLAVPHVPVFSMRTPGSVGALGNPLAQDDLPGRLAASRRVAIRPLRFEARTGDDTVVTGVAINEVAIVRSRFQAARLHVCMDGDEVDLFGDGLVVASAVGSTGYCRSLGGPCLPLEADMLALAGIAVRQPSEGLHVALPSQSVVRVQVVDPLFRPVHVETHATLVRDVCEIVMRGSCEPALTLLLEQNEAPRRGGAEHATMQSTDDLRGLW
jgi:NAD+ kinase